MPESTTKTVAVAVYIVEDETGLFTLRVFSEPEIAQRGGALLVEADLAGKYPWLEHLGWIKGLITAGNRLQMTDDLSRLVRRCSRRMVLVSDWDTLEYATIDWPGGPLN